jgi:multisubunit Na+/H+ antiporter MnhC subunit
VAEIQSHLVEYLAVDEGLLGDPTTGEPVVLLTIRPEPLVSFESVNLAIPMSQAGRLFADLTNLLMPFVLLVSLLAATLGCSARVQVERTSTAEKANTAIQLSLLQSRSSPPPSAPKPTTIINVGSGSVHVGEVPAQVQPSRPRTTLNTKIGSPSTYSAHGSLAFLGYVAVCSLVGAAVVLMLATVGRKTGGPLVPILGLLVAAAVILQALPQAESGFQVIPQLPWQCSGFFSALASILGWAGILLAALIAATRCLDAPKIFSGMVLFVMGINLLVSLGSGLAGTEVASVSPRSPATAEKKTAAPVDLLHTRPPEVVTKTDPPAVKTPPPPIQPPPSPPSPPKPVAPAAKPINLSGNTFVLNYQAGDVTYRSETHIHLHEPPKVQERIVIQREVEKKPPRRPVEDPCDRGQREHEERVRRWREFPKAY